jgi:fengycin family lipopeptide synthetase D
MHSLAAVNTFNEHDTVVQMARCSFDIHVQDILGTLTIGASVTILHPHGTTDFDYLSRVLDDKQITYINSVPSLFGAIFSFVKLTDKKSMLTHLRSICSGGEYT